MKRTAAWFVPVALTTLIATGCGGGSPAGNAASNGTTGSANQTITLRFSWWGDQTRATITQQVIDLYEKLHPNVKIQPEFTSYANYAQKLTTEAAGGNLPDVVQMNYGPMITQFTTQGLL
ncbi:extracellular solute-binding protein, partial [Alicyclobacillus sp.]|uniref:ABC transporter substrate-binding protein n=1 Tax=Alicyclobacillus sp. TaxID=61169 RepID=UPI0025BC84A6